MLSDCKWKSENTKQYEYFSFLILLNYLIITFQKFGIITEVNGFVRIIINYRTYLTILMNLTALNSYASIH
jgi:hypothetical protein